MKCPQCHFENPDDSSYCSKCGTQILLSAQIPSSKTETLQMPTEELSRGAVFAGRYEIIEELGQGGMGKVYRVFDRKLDGEVGLKLVKPEISSDKNAIDRFRNELKLAREIAHRNVCRMF